MNTLNEILDYCKEEKPVGALLLTGEWGCGKTYLIDNELRNPNPDSPLIVLRISLFGVSSVIELNKIIKRTWFKENLIRHNIKPNFFKKLNYLKNRVLEIPFFPDYVNKLLEIDFIDFLDEIPVIDGKKVVLIFDDLERTKLNIVDVLGCINDFCENKGFHTIIVANEEKITQHISNEDNINNEEIDKNKINYKEIKEKIIQRTIKFQPNYEKIITSILEQMKFSDEKYSEFLKEHVDDIVMAFSPNNEKCFHNIRSLKCALQDFGRLYYKFKESEIKDINLWLTNFIILVMCYKADILIDDNNYDINFKKYYPQFNEKYILKSTLQWVLHGVWDEKAFSLEIETIIQQQKAKTPLEKLKVYQFVTLDEETIDNGYSDYIHEAYGGMLTLNQYVNFILNAYYAGLCEYDININWSKVKEGIKKRIKYIKDNSISDTPISLVIGENKLEKLNINEKNAYHLIQNFSDNNEFEYYLNRKKYCDYLKEYQCAAFALIKDKKYDVFNKEMANATFESFKDSDYSDRNYFATQFIYTWEDIIDDSYFDKKNSTVGFETLLNLLSDLEAQIDSDNKFVYKYQLIIFKENVKNILTELAKDNNDEITSDLKGLK